MTSNFRIVVHASVFLIPFLVEATSKSTVTVALAATTLVYVLSEALRRNGKRVPLITRFTLAMSRENESPHFVAAPVYLALGVILSLLVLPENIAYASLTIAAVGDPMASWVGNRFGRMRVGRKTAEGFAAGLLASFVGALLWVPPYLALIGSLAGMSLELLEFLDDNLTIPIGAGSAMLVTSIL